MIRSLDLTLYVMHINGSGRHGTALGANSTSPTSCSAIIGWVTAFFTS